MWVWVCFAMVYNVYVVAGVVGVGVGVCVLQGVGVGCV